MANRVEGDQVVTGRVIAQGGVELPSTQRLLQANLSNQKHRGLAQAGTAAAIAATIIYECHGSSGLLKKLCAGSQTKCTGDATITWTVKKNGSTIGTIVLDSSNTNLISEDTTPSSLTVAEGDVITAEQAVAAGTGVLGTGSWLELVVNEDNVQ